MQPGLQQQQQLLLVPQPQPQPLPQLDAVAVYRRLPKESYQMMAVPTLVDLVVLRDDAIQRLRKALKNEKQIARR